jgi:hypothetical protein
MKKVDWTKPLQHSKKTPCTYIGPADVLGTTCHLVQLGGRIWRYDDFGYPYTDDNKVGRQRMIRNEGVSDDEEVPASAVDGGALDELRVNLEKRIGGAQGQVSALRIDIMKRLDEQAAQLSRILQIVSPLAEPPAAPVAAPGKVRAVGEQTAHG